MNCFLLSVSALILFPCILFADLPKLKMPFQPQDVRGWEKLAFGMSDRSGKRVCGSGWPLSCDSLAKTAGARDIRVATLLNRLYNISVEYCRLEELNTQPCGKTKQIYDRFQKRYGRATERRRHASIETRAWNFPHTRIQMTIINGKTTRIDYTHVTYLKQVRALMNRQP